MRRATMGRRNAGGEAALVIAVAVLVATVVAFFLIPAIFLVAGVFYGISAHRSYRRHQSTP